MAYMVRTVCAGCVRETKKMHTWNAQRKGAVRAMRANPTPERQKAANERAAEERLRWRLNANFGARDYHLVLHYCDKTRGLAQCLEDLKLFLRKLRARLAKAGQTLRYIAVTETKRMTNIHHHMILRKCDVDLLQEIWEQVCGGNISLRPLDRRGNHAKLASYLIKESRSTLRRMEELGKRGKRYHCSRNLIIPKPQYRRVEANHWAEQPRPKKGAYLYKWDDGQTVCNGVDERGLEWQEYFEIYAEGVQLCV